MDPLTAIMVVLVFVAVLVTMLIEDSSPAALLNIPALVLVFVGTFGAGAGGLLKADLVTTLKGGKKALTGTAPYAELGEQITLVTSGVVNVAEVTAA